MRAFIQFAESYFELIKALSLEVKNQATDGKLEISAIGIRRKTICKKIDGIQGMFDGISYEWWNDVEARILSANYDPERLEFYRSILGDQNLRMVMACGRQLGFGFVTGGVHARTKFRKMVEERPELRWQYIVGILDYFMERFTVDKPDFVFFNEITFPWELAACLIAEHLRIPFFTMCYTRSGGGYIIIDNPYQEYSLVDSMFEKMLNDPSGVADEMAEAHRRLSSFRDRPADPEYTVELHKMMKRQTSTFGIVRTFSADLMKHAAVSFGLLGTRGVLRFENWADMARWNLSSAMEVRKALRSNKVFEDAAQHVGSNYLFYPLHVEPEVTTTLMSPHLSNQLTFIEQIAKSMPAGYKLLVKEHQPSLGRRPKGFYQRLKAFPDVHLISPFEDNFSLIKNAKIVCVISGTAAWEAIMLGVPSIVVGHAQYLGLGAGYIKCKNLFKLVDDIKQALVMDPVPDERIVAFIAATLKVQSSLTPRSVAYWHYGLDPDEIIDQEGIKDLAAQILLLYKEKTATH